MLHAIIAIAPHLKEDKSMASNDVEKYIKHCMRMSLSGMPRQAKFAVRCIAALLNTEKARAQLTTVFRESLKRITLSDPQCCTALKALGSCIEADAVGFSEQLHPVIEVFMLFLQKSSKTKCRRELKDEGVEVFCCP
ncbi:unnamed protein product [Gongylonema pulchrum]|uniref:Uncharacterized protein n=1 Tax=Gongylonema pulchrum TaxID=637853 RepID=A0A3P6R9I6_9BILA|nr:unnamed protein product [Gongylonema pulchrum]